MVAYRDEKGRLLPGSTLPGAGRNFALERQFKAAFKDDWVAFEGVLRDIIMGRMPVGMTGHSEVKIRDRIEALKLVYERTYGKAKITLDLAHDITASGLAGVDVDSLDESVLDALAETIQKQLDPRGAKRVTAAKVLDVVSVRDVKPVNVEQEQAQALAPVVVAQELELELAPQPEPELVPQPELAQEPEPIETEAVRVIFKGSNNVVQAVFYPGSREVEVVFLSGQRYRFANFTRAKLDEWGLAISAGRWFNANIRSQPELHPPVGPRMA